ncbi:trypsin-like [Oculina patagonica]
MSAFSDDDIKGSCGVSRLGHSRVIGGNDASPGAWPWQVGLHNRRGGFFCGGTLITPEWVVTAAHCISSLSPSYYVLRLGDHNRNSNEGTEQNIPASRVIKHPSYGSGGRLNNDIALIKLSRAAIINDRVSPACLPEANYIVPHWSNCYITGWGKIKHPGSTYPILQQAKIYALSESDCKSKYKGVTKQMLCAGDLDNGRGGCHGDSGGPFVCKGSNGLWFLQGAVSFGRGDCDAYRAYTVFARVSMFRGWIDRYV